MWSYRTSIQFKRPFFSGNSFSFFWFFSFIISMIKLWMTFSSESGWRDGRVRVFSVSTDQQDVDNQRYGVLVYANTRGLGSLQFVEDTASGRLAWRERAVGRLLTETTQTGDVVLFAEVSRMARSTLQVLEMLACCMQRGVHVHIAKQQMVLDGSLPSRITATVLGLAAEIEREFIAMRTREALAKRWAEGKPLGRPKGKPAARLKLDAQEVVIRGYLAKGINKLAIAKLVECAPSTLYAWLARRNLRPSRGPARVQDSSATP